MYCIYQDHLITNLRVKCVIQIFDLYDQSGQGFITFREVLISLSSLKLTCTFLSLLLLVHSFYLSLSLPPQTLTGLCSSVCRCVQFVAASGSISKNKDFKSQMKVAFNACNLRSDGQISALEVQFCLYYMSLFGISTSLLP